MNKGIPPEKCYAMLSYIFNSHMNQKQTNKKQKHKTKRKSGTYTEYSKSTCVSACVKLHVHVCSRVCDNSKLSQKLCVCVCVCVCVCLSLSLSSQETSHPSSFCQTVFVIHLCTKCSANIDKKNMAVIHYDTYPRTHFTRTIPLLFKASFHTHTHTKCTHTQACAHTHIQTHTHTHMCMQAHIYTHQPPHIHYSTDQTLQPRRLCNKA